MLEKLIQAAILTFLLKLLMGISAPLESEPFPVSDWPETPSFPTVSQPVLVSQHYETQD
jgi:hypothetical protein